MKITHKLARPLLRRNGEAQQGREIEPHLDGDRLHEYGAFRDGMNDRAGVRGGNQSNEGRRGKTP
jgi:hypothetical protein